MIDFQKRGQDNMFLSVTPMLVFAILIWKHKDVMVIRKSELELESVKAHTRPQNFMC
jgi:hypothetical protein